MEHVTIAALIESEHRLAAREPHSQQRRDALRERDRALAARARSERRRRLRASVAHVVRRLAEAIEPPRPVCTAPAPDAR